MPTQEIREENKGRLIFKGGRILDGKGQVINAGNVIIKGAKIVDVEENTRLLRYSKDTVINIDGKTLLPGIIDCHVHLCLDGGPNPVKGLNEQPDASLALNCAKHARATIESGVTTVRDLGGKNFINIALKYAIENRIVVGPRVISCGKMICMTGGHGWTFGAREADGVSEIRKAVREQLKAGADFIKLVATGGVLTEGILEPGGSQLTYEELAAAVEEARKANRKTSSHALGNDGIKNSIRAGVNYIEHGVYLDDEAIDLLVGNKNILIPTLSPPTKILETRKSIGIPDFVVKRMENVKDIHIKSLKKALKRQVKIAMGSDAGCPCNPHGDNLRELDELVKIGLSPMDAIISSTQVAAEVLGMAKNIGTIEPGKIADLIIIDGNPLEDISILREKRRLLYVIKEGEIVFKKN